MRARVLFFHLLFLVMVLGGCGPGKVDRILVNGIQQTGSGPSGLVLTRKGDSNEVPVATQLKQGDELQTRDGVTAVIWLQGGSRLFLAPNTHIQLVNPYHIIKLFTSVGDAIGQIFIHAKDSLRIDSDYVSAVTQGTEYMVTRGPGDEVTVSVISGKVAITSNTGQFAPVYLSRMETGSLSPGKAPQKQRMSEAQSNEIMNWVNDIEIKTGSVNNGLLVPDVTGIPLSQAQRRLQYENFRAGKEIPSIDGSGPLGIVLLQNPLAGSRVKQSQSVQLTYKAEATTVPQLIGITREVAFNRIQQAKLVPGSVSTRITGTAGVDMVLEQHPAPRTRVPVRSQVNLVVEDESVSIPSMVGLPLDRAQHMLAQIGLTLRSVQKEITGKYPVNTVISQSFNPMQLVAPGTPVVLTVEGDSVIVPGVVNFNRRDAITRLDSVGLRADTQQSRLVAGYQPDTVLEQHPVQGSRVAPGSVVSLIMAQKGVTVPYIVNMSYANASKILEGMGLYMGNVTRQERTDKRRDTVLSQNPQQGTLVHEGSSVNIALATTPVRVPSPPITHQPPSPGNLSVMRPPPQVYSTLSFCTVPNVIGKLERDARKILTDAGFTVEVEWVRGNGTYKQSLEPNKAAPCGSKVTITCGRVY